MNNRRADEIFEKYVQVGNKSLGTPFRRPCHQAKHVEQNGTKTENRGVIFNFQLPRWAIKMAPAEALPLRPPDPRSPLLEMCSLLHTASRQQEFPLDFFGAAFPERFSHHPSSLRSLRYALCHLCQFHRRYYEAR